MLQNRITACFGVFVVMALSNAVVPVLPSLAGGTTAQGLIYSAYFVGAFLMTLPAGLLADRIDPVRLVQAGLGITLLSGIGFFLAPGGFYPILLARLFEGVAGGLFMSSALAWVNEQSDHERLSGIFMAMLNAGLVVGLLATGWLVERVHDPYSGLAVFTAASLGAFLLSLVMRPGTAMPREWGTFPEETAIRRLVRVGSQYYWLWISGIILIGASGVVTAIYPDYSDLNPSSLAMAVAAMNIATMVTVMSISRMALPPVPSIRISALLLAAAMIICLFSPWGFILVGITQGVIILCQMAFLAETEVQQGTVMGVFNTASYCGMSILPSMAAFVAEMGGFPVAFISTAALCLLAAAIVGRCSACRVQKSGRLLT
jgi:MFS family permease